MRIKYKINETAFAGGLFSRGLDRYYKPEFITHLGLRNTEYNVFRLVYFCTDQNMYGGYMTYTCAEIAKELQVSKSCVEKVILRLRRRGLIIREMVQRNGKLCPGYRVDKQDIKRRIDEVNKQSAPLRQDEPDASPEGRGRSLCQDEPDTSPEGR